MLNIYCTKKLRDYLNIAEEFAVISESDTCDLSSWYGHVFEVEFDPYLWNRNTEKHLLLVNEQSLLSFCIRIPDELPIDLLLAELSDYFKACFVENRFTEKQIQYLTNSYREIRFSKAASPRMTGFLRSLAFDYARNIRADVPYEMYDGYEFKDRLEYRKSLNELKRESLSKKTPRKTAKYLTNLAMRRAT